MLNETTVSTLDGVLIEIVNDPLIGANIVFPTVFSSPLVVPVMDTNAKSLSLIMTVPVDGDPKVISGSVTVIFEMTRFTVSGASTKLSLFGTTAIVAVVLPAKIVTEPAGIAT